METEVTPPSRVWTEAPARCDGSTDALRRMMLRQALAAMAVTIAGPSVAARALSREDVFIAAWDDAAGGHHVGELAVSASGVRVRRRIEVPTRAHGLLVEADGALLAVARRPGDWILRWWPDGARPPQWQWTSADRRVTGHAVRTPDGRHVLTGEADQDRGAGLVVVREARSLEPVAEWPTDGIDVHQMLFDRDGTLVVANGGVPTRPESGRVKDTVAALDSSIVRLDAATGARLGQWRLADPMLSLRHLAWCGPLLGVALQSEHADASERARAPLLAVFDGERLTAHAAEPPLAGYGGDICALPDGWAVSATRRAAVARYDTRGNLVGLQPLPEACALAVADGRPCIGGRDNVIGARAETPVPLPQLRLDNHWRRLGG